MPVLKLKNADKTRTFSVRLPADLISEIDAVKADADAAGFVFDVSDIVNKSVSAAVRAARAELSTNCKQSVDTIADNLAPHAQASGWREDGGASGRHGSELS